MLTRRFNTTALWVLGLSGLTLLPSAVGEDKKPPKFSHERWDRLLKANVTAEGWVNYANFSGKDAAELKAYLKELAEAKTSKVGDKNELKAFWINAFNAICIQRGI